MREKLETRYCKIEVLLNYWDKLIGQIAMRSSKLNDDKANQLIR